MEDLPDRQFAMKLTGLGFVSSQQIIITLFITLQY